MRDSTSLPSAALPSSSVSPVERKPTRRIWLVRLTYLLITLIGLSTLLGLFILIFGRVSGTEFSPESLETRSFSYYEIPGIRYQVSPIVRIVTVGGVEQQLQSQQLVTLLPASRWDLVTAQRMTDWIDPRGASILNAYLRARTSDNRDYWADWNANYSELAKTLWPEVILLARRRLYIFIPNLMQLARQASDGREVEGIVTGSNAVEPSSASNAWEPQKLQREIARTLERRLLELAEIHRERGQPELAQRLLDWAAEYAK